jgi:hypothetical protein
MQGLDFSQLPVAYHSEEGAITAPVYRAAAPCYLGDTLWEEGEVIITELVPNGQMEPLNKAAGDRFDAWTSSLPLNGSNLREGDIIEAANMLRADAGSMSSDDFNRAIIKLALSLKAKRESLGQPSAACAARVLGRRDDRAAAVQCPRRRCPPWLDGRHEAADPACRRPSPPPPARRRRAMGNTPTPEQPPPA